MGRLSMQVCSLLVFLNIINLSICLLDIVVVSGNLLKNTSYFRIGDEPGNFNRPPRTDEESDRIKWVNKYLSVTSYCISDYIYH